MKKMSVHSAARAVANEPILEPRGARRIVWCAPIRGGALRQGITNMHHTTRAPIGRRAFTIVEVMIVLVIIGLIGAIVGINLVGAAKKAREQTTQATLKNIQAALTMFHGTNGSYPQSAGSLSALVQQNVLQLTTNPVDAWNREILFYSDGVNYQLISVGADGIEDTADDIIVLPEHQ